MHPFEARLAAALGNTQGETKQRSTTYLAAVSGGADSTAMLAALAALRADMGFIVHCVHVEHGIRAAWESRGDALAVKGLCDKLVIPCRVISIPPGRIAAFAARSGSGVEAAARSFRYRALRLERQRVNADWILTAHTRDDLLETILMRVLRGSGPAGLAPIPRIRGRLLRPLLDFRRRDALEYLENRDIPYRTDSTNMDIAFLRNRVRLKLIPVLDDFFPSWRSSLSALAETQALTAEFLASEARRRLPWEKAAGQAGLRLNAADFLAAPQILREEAIFCAVDMLAGKGRRETGVHEGNLGLRPRVPKRSTVRRAAEHGDAEDLGPVRLEKQPDFIYLQPKNRSTGERGFSLLIKKAGLYTLKTGVLYKRSPTLNIHVFSADSEKTASPRAFSAGFSGTLPLVFRNYKTGDFILKGGRKCRFSDILDRNAFSGYTGIITACDAEGPVAFIGLGEKLPVISRDNASIDNSLKNYFFEVSVEDTNV